MISQVPLQPLHAPNIGETDILSIGQSYEGSGQTLRVVKRHKVRRTFWARVKEALSDRGLPDTQTYAAKLAGVEQPSVSDWNKPGGFPKLANGIELADQLGVCVEWLYLERGPKRPGRPDDAEAQRLWDLWPRLTEDAKADLVGYAAVRAGPFEQQGDNDKNLSAS